MTTSIVPIQAQLTPALKAHRFAEITPMLGEAELRQLADDIAETGQREPIMLTQGNEILDGRNRLKACQLAGVKPWCERFPSDDEAEMLRFVVSKNVKRRHLTSGQLAVLAEEVTAEFERLAKAKQRAQGEHGKGVGRPKKTLSNELKGAPPDDAEKPLPKELGKGSAGVEDEPAGRHSREAAAQAAAAVGGGTNRQYVSDVKRIKAHPLGESLVPKLKAGLMTVPQAVRQIKEHDREEKRQDSPERNPAPKIDLILALNGIASLEDPLGSLKSGGSLLARINSCELANLLERTKPLMFRSVFTVLADKPVPRRVSGRQVNVTSTSIAWMTRGKPCAIDAELDDVLKGYRLPTVDDPLPVDLLVDLIDGFCPEGGSVSVLGANDTAVDKFVTESGRTLVEPSNITHTDKSRKTKETTA